MVAALAALAVVVVVTTAAAGVVKGSVFHGICAPS